MFKYSFATSARFILFSLLSWGLSAIVLLGGVSSTATAQTITHVPLYTFHGDRDGDVFGSVSGAGDVNGDGKADLIVGVRGDFNEIEEYTGSARVFSGSDGSVLYNFDSDSTVDAFGASVSSAGDVNGDGRADLIVGAPHDTNNGDYSGSARVLSGIDGSVLYNFNGDSAFDRFGESVSGAGDVNGDGRADLIIGATGVDNNGFLSGSVRVFSGIDGSVLFNFNGDSASDYFGGSVSSAGDVNGDGRADLIVGATGVDNNGGISGSARVLSGIDGSVLYNFDGDSRGDRLGQSVSGAGDVNGDGRADMIVGASGDDDNGSISGSARVLSGIDGSVLYNFDGNNAFDQFGTSVSGAGDVNRDGLADMIVGAPGDTTNGDGSGSARVLSGSDGSVLHNFDGDSAGDYFGGSVSGAGDINGDGIDDFIVSAARGGTNGSGYARVFVSQILGDCNQDHVVNFLDIAPFILSLSTGDFLGQADINQDGYVGLLDISLFIEILSGR